MTCDLLKTIRGKNMHLKQMGQCLNCPLECCIEDDFTENFCNLDVKLKVRRRRGIGFISSIVGTMVATISLLSGKLEEMEKLK